jgi:hypothetical protein
MKITKEWLEEKSACSEGKEWFFAQKEAEGKKVCLKLIKAEKLDWANWLVVRLMNHNQQIQYAIFAAEQVIEIYEKQYPKDDRPRKAIEAAREYLKWPTKENRDAARAAAGAAGDAAVSAWAAGAAGATWNSAGAAWAAGAAGNAARYAAGEAGDAARYAAGDEMKPKIIKYGLKILEVSHAEK